MAYTQTPGRGNFNKTGNGLPNGIASGSTEPTIEKTKAFTEAKTNMEVAAASKGGSIGSAQGITINPATSEAKPNIKSTKTINYPNKTTGVFSADGSKELYRGRTDSKETKGFLKSSANKIAYENEGATKNANFYNVNSGAKADLTTEDKQTLVKLGKAIIKK